MCERGAGDNVVYVCVICMYGWVDASMDACMYVCMHACMNECMNEGIND